jgi:hypothetical protein
MKSVKNKVALVTGSARGIGKAIAIRYGSLGASVAGSGNLLFGIIVYLIAIGISFVYIQSVLYLKLSRFKIAIRQFRYSVVFLIFSFNCQ